MLPVFYHSDTTSTQELFEYRNCSNGVVTVSNERAGATTRLCRVTTHECTEVCKFF